MGCSWLLPACLFTQVIVSAAVVVLYLPSPLFSYHPCLLQMPLRLPIAVMVTPSYISLQLAQCLPKHIVEQPAVYPVLYCGQEIHSTICDGCCDSIGGHYKACNLTEYVKVVCIAAKSSPPTPQKMVCIPE